MRKNRRNCRGVMLATSDLLILIPFVVICFLALINSILIASYKIKLSHIAVMAAEYAAELPPDSEVEAEVSKMTKHLIDLSKLPIKKVSVSTQMSNLEETEIIEVEIAGNFPLLEGSFLPSCLSINERAAAPIPGNQVKAIIGITPYPYAQGEDREKPSVYVPVIRPTHDLPVWSFPCDTALNYLQVVEGKKPDVMQSPAVAQHRQHPSIY